MELRESIESVLRAEEYEKYIDNDMYKVPLKNIRVLLTIYNNEKGKEPLILSVITNYNNFNISYLCFEFLLRVKEIEKAFQYLEKNLNKTRGLTQINFLEYYSLFNKFLARLNYLIDDSHFESRELDLLRNYVLDLNKLLPKSHDKLKQGYNQNNEVSINHELRKEILKKLEMKKVESISNLYGGEIEKQDIKNVLEKIKELEISSSIGLAFKKLEDKYYEAEDKNEFAMFGGYIRQTLMGLIKEISLRISKDKKEVIKEKDEQYRNYLHNCGLINDGLWRMIGALYDFLSCEINHNVETDKEYYKIGLNIAAQLSYLLLKDYEKYVKENKLGVK